MEDQIPTSLPPEIQRLEANRRAFDLPLLQLPSYDEIGRSKDKVFEKVGDTLVPKKPTFQEQLQESARKFQGVPDQLNPVGEYSKAQSEGYDNPLLPYDPMVDMNEVYAQYDPTTWGDVAKKTWDTAVLNSWSGMQTIYHGLKEGITEGRPSALWDNSYSKELAEMTLNMEKMNPMRFTEEEQGTTSAWLKQVLPSLGYIGAGAAEVAVQHAMFTLGGAVIGAVAGEGVGAVPGAIAGSVAAYAKDAQTVANVITNMGRASRAVAALNTVNKIKTAGQMFGRGLLATNGEAALMGQLAGHRALEEQKAEHFKATGQYLSGDALKEAEENAKSTINTTYGLNLPLLAAGEVYMFGNLIRGKALPGVIDKLAYKIDKVSGKAVQTNAWLKVGGEFLKNAAVQGNEEVFQSIIEDASVNYFTQKKENRDNYLESFAESAYKRAMSGEAAGDFMAGAVIGAIPGSANFLAVGKVKANSKSFVNAYNTSTSEYFDSLGNNLKTNGKLQDALIAGDSQAAREQYRNHIVDLVNTQARIGSTQAFSETLDALSDMNNADFRKYTGLALNQEEQDKVLSGVTTEYKRAAQLRNQVDGAFQINPFESESWLQQKLNNGKASYALTNPGATKEEKDKAKVAAQHVWDVFKSTLTSNLVKHADVGQQRQEIEDVGSQVSPDFLFITGSDPERIISDRRTLLEARVSARVPGWVQDKALLDKINSREDLKDQYQEILNAADKQTPGIKELVLAHNRELQTEQLLYKEIGRLNTPAGQRREIKKILDWQNWYERQIADTEETVPVTQAAAPVVAQPTTAPEETVPTPPTQQEPVAVAEPIAAVQPVEEVLGDEILEEEVSPPVFATEESIVDDLDSLYGEGKGEDYVLETITPSVKEALKPNVQVPVLDTSMPDDLQVDDTAIPEAVGNMEEGDVIVPEENGVEVTLKGEPVKKITKEKEKVKIEKESGEIVELPPSDVTLLRTEKAPESPVTDVARFIAENNISADKATILKSLVENNYVEIVCQ
jgi:hypothetical protein